MRTKAAPMGALTALTTILLVGAAATAACASPTPTPTASPAANGAVPTRDQLRKMLLTPEELAPATGTTWTAHEAAQGDGPANSSGCPGLDNAVLANNTGLVDTGPVDFLAANGDLIEQNIAYDTNAAQHVRELAQGIDSCPAMSMDGVKYPIQRMPMGDSVAGFRVMVNGKSGSVVLAGAHGDHVVELIASDHGDADSHYQALLDLAYNRIDHPR